MRGKGLDAVRTVADVLGAFRVVAHETEDLAELAAQLDRQVLRDAAEREDEELFVTALVVAVGARARTARSSVGPGTGRGPPGPGRWARARE